MIDEKFMNGFLLTVIAEVNCSWLLYAGYR